MADNKFEKLVFAHRGGVGPFPENSLEMFRIGLQEGASGIELDVRMTGDKKMVVFHDQNGRRMCNTQHRISSSTLDEIRTWKLRHSKDEEDAEYQIHRIPTLNEALEAFPNAAFSIDVKDKGLEPVSQTIKIIRQHNASFRCRLGSFAQENYEAIKHYGYEGPVTLGRNELLKLYLLPNSLNGSQFSENDIVCVPPYWGPFVFSQRWFIERCHQKGLRVDFWVINSKLAAQELLEKGADGFVTDETASLVRTCKNWELNQEKSGRKSR